MHIRCQPQYDLSQRPNNDPASLIIKVLCNDVYLLETDLAETFGWVDIPHTLHTSSSSSLKVGETDRYVE